MISLHVLVQIRLSASLTLPTLFESPSFSLLCFNSRLFGIALVYSHKNAIFWLLCSISDLGKMTISSLKTRR